MKEYIVSVCLTAIVSSVAVLVTPTLKKGELSPYVRLVSSFVLICVIISPLTNIAPCDPESKIDSFIDGLDLPDDNFYESGTLDALSKLNATCLEAAVRDALCQKFSLDETDIKIEAQYSFTEEKTEYTRILVLLHGKAVLKDPKQIEKYVTEISGIHCDCALG